MCANERILLCRTHLGEKAFWRALVSMVNQSKREFNLVAICKVFGGNVKR